MSAKYSISLSKIAKMHGLETVYTPKDLSEIMVTSPDVNRPGLLLTGFTKYFAPDRIQFLGITEVEYLHGSKDDERVRKIKRLLSRKPVAVVITRNQEFAPEFLELAAKYEVPLLRTSDGTSS
ncbi:MAG: HPr kinase/phosphorylase, partial [Acutalibacteraceae bacterium]|nr:HPr kinase/phosphorylase [Acutalibacteraceae bacterium]